MVMAHLDDGVAIIEEDGRVLHANQALLTAFGSREPEPIERVQDPDQRQGQAYHPDGRPLEEHENPLVRAMAGEVINAEEIHHTDEYGIFRVLETSAFQVPHAEGAPKRVMIVLRDITAASKYRESLVGFATVFDKKVFQRLISASGVGPSLALGMLSALSGERVVRAIRDADNPERAARELRAAFTS